MGRWWKGSLFVMAWTTGRIAGEAIARRLRQAAVALAARELLAFFFTNEVDGLCFRNMCRRPLLGGPIHI